MTQDIWNQIRDCLDDDEDGQGYLFDTVKTHRNEICHALTGVTTGELSDGYHTFNELYEHRHTLFTALCRCNPALAWRSKLHSDGTMFDGWFIAGLMTPAGNATYHIPIRLWDDLAGVSELPNAPEWDGHTSDDVIKRLRTVPETLGAPA